MKSPVVWICCGMVLFMGMNVDAWGGLFNRFSPEMLSNMGYGGHGNFRNQPQFQVIYIIIMILCSKYLQLGETFIL